MDPQVGLNKKCCSQPNPDNENYEYRIKMPLVVRLQTPNYRPFVNEIFSGIDSYYNESLLMPQNRTQRLSCELLNIDELEKVINKLEINPHDKLFFDEWRKIEPSLGKGNLAEIKQSVKRFITQEFDSKIGTQILIPLNKWLATASIGKIAEVMQKKIIAQTPAYHRLIECQNCLMKYSREKGKVTPFTHLLHGVLERLRLMVDCLEKGDNFNAKTKDQSFLGCISQIIKNDYSSFGINQMDKNLKKYSKKIKHIIFTILDGEKNSEKIIDYLRRINSIHVIQNKLMKQVKPAALKQVMYFNHQWTEKENHDFRPMPLNQISIPRVLDLYYREGNTMGAPILINDELVFSEGTSCQPDNFFFNFFSLLYRAFGFEINKESLRKEIDYALKNLDAGEVHDLKKFSDHTLKCFHLLKMGMTDAWTRAELYLRWRFSVLLEGDSTKVRLSGNKFVSLNFKIDKTNHVDSHVEQVRSLRITHQPQPHAFDIMISKIDVSLKVFYPKNQSNTFIMRILNFIVNPEVQKVIANDVESSLINFKEDEFVAHQYMLYQMKHKGIECPNKGLEHEFIAKHFSEKNIIVNYHHNRK